MSKKLTAFFWGNFGAFITRIKFQIHIWAYLANKIFSSEIIPWAQRYLIVTITITIT
jgi:hypothetical protein